MQNTLESWAHVACMYAIVLLSFVYVEFDT